jgi:hypothetical protein
MRFIPYKQQVRDAETDAFLGVAGTAFSVRPDHDDGGLSVTWVEHYGPKDDVTLKTAGTAFRESLPSKKLGSKAYFAIGQAGPTRTISQSYGKNIRLVHAPDGPNTGHVEIHRFSDEDRSLLDALSEAYSEHVSAKYLQLV